MTNIVVCVFAVLLCLVNAVVWTVYSELPLMGIVWCFAAFSCVMMQRWSRG